MYSKHIDLYQDLCTGLTDWLKVLDNSRKRFQDFELEEEHMTQFEGCNGYPAICYKCHMDPQGFYQIYRYYTLALVDKFLLSYVEIVTLQMTFNYMPKTHYYFAVAAEALL